MSKRPAPPHDRTSGKRTRASAGDDRQHWSVATTENEAVLYMELDAGIMESAGSGATTTMQGLVASIVETDGALRSAQTKLEGKRVMLENPVREVSAGEQRRRQVKSALSNRSILSNRQMRKLGMLDVDRKEIKYDLFVPIHQLWLQYFQQTTADSTAASVLQSKLMKADLHGAIIVVIRSRCPSLIGQRGIVYRETQYTFQIVTSTNATKVLPKQHSVFGVVAQGCLLEIFGNNFLYRPSERSARKYKAHGKSLRL
ncbi:Ribonuclease P/MRP, subunit p29 [Plasmodiophora brassicae]